MFGKIKKIYKAFMACDGDTFDYFLSDLTTFARFYGINYWSDDWKLNKVARSFVPLFMFFLYAVVFEAYFVMHSRDDFGLMLHVSIISLQGNLTLGKFLVLFMHRRKIRELIDEVRNDFWKIDDGDWLKKKALLEGSRFMRRLIRFAMLFYFSAVTLYLIAPVFGMIFYSQFDSPMRIPFPGFDNERWAVYIGNYILQIACSEFGVFILLFLEFLQPVFIIQCTVQINYLIKLLQPLTCVDDENRKEIKRILQEVHGTYVKLRAFVNKLSQVFAWIIFLQLLKSTFDIAIAIYIVTTVSDGNKEFEIIISMLIVVLQLALYCFCGQHLTDKFKELYDNMQQVCWDEFTLEEKRDYLKILHSMQQPVVIRSHFSELSLVAFKNILNSAYSYYAVLCNLALKN